MNQQTEHEWSELLNHARTEPFVVEQVRLKRSGIQLKGAFELPPLACLPAEDQVFITAFIIHHGSLKQMEKLYGASYPTIKAKLGKIADKLQLVATEVAAPADSDDVLDRLEAGEIEVEEAIAAIRGERL